MNTNEQTIHQMGLGISSLVKQATGRESVSNIDMDWVSVEQLARYIYGSGSGDMVSFNTNIPDAIESLIAYITAVQDLHGYDNPWPGGAGKNLLPISTSNSSTVNDVAWTNNNDGSYKANGTASSNSYFGNSSIGISLGVLPAGDYTVSAAHSDGSLSTDILMRIGKGSGSTLVSINVSPLTFTADGTSEYFVAFRIDSGVTVSNETIFVQVESGSSYTDWVPYANICPITGWTGCNVARTGKNLLTDEGYAWVNSTGEKTVNYTAISSVDLIPTAPGEKFTYYRNQQTTQNSSLVARLYNANRVYIGNGTTMFSTETGSKTITIPANAYYVTFTQYGAVGVTDLQVQVERGDTYTGFEEPISNVYPFSWQTEAGTVYGGVLDVLSGVLTVTHKTVTFTGADSENWSYSGEQQKSRFRIDIPDAYVIRNVPTVRTSVMCNIGLFIDTGIEELGCYIYPGDPDSPRFAYCPPIPYTMDAAAFKTWLQSNNLQIVYQIAEPVTYQLTAQEVTALIGQNNIFADTGKVSVQYKVKEDLV